MDVTKYIYNFREKEKMRSMVGDRKKHQEIWKGQITKRLDLKTSKRKLWVSPKDTK